MSAAAVPPRSLLVVRLGAMGDVIHTIPAVSALRDVFPDTRIGWVIEQRWAELLCAKDAARSGPRSPSRPLIDFVHVVDTKTWRKSLLSVETRRKIAAAWREVRNQHYEVAIDFQGALKSAAIARSAGAHTVIGMQHPRERPSRMFYTKLAATRGRHVIEHYRALAEAVAGRSLAQCPAQFPHDDFLVMVQQNSFTSGRRDNVSGERSRVPAREIVLDLGAIDVAVMVKGRSDSGKDPR